MAAIAENQDVGFTDINADIPALDFTAPSTRNATLSRLRSISQRKMNAYTNVMCGGSGTDFIALTARVTRSFDNRPRTAAEGPFIDLLESSMTHGGSHSVGHFDGYIVPKDEQVVTRLLFLREYQRAPWYAQEALVSGVDRNVEALALTAELLNTLDPDSALHFSRLTGAPVDVVLTPRDYPRDANDARLAHITLITDLFGEQGVRFMNVDQFRDHLKANRKRSTRKGLGMGPTKLEWWLSNTMPGGAWKQDHEWTTAFPGDMDAVLMRKSTTTGADEVAAVIEYKSDTKGYPIETEAAGNYKNDATRFNVLDDVCTILNVPLVMVFWSTQHRNAKVVFRNATTKNEESPKIVYAATYEEAAQRVGALILAKVGGVPAPAPAPVVNASQAPRFKLFHAPATPTVVRKPPVFVHAPVNDRGASNVSAFPRGAGGAAMFQRLAQRVA